MRSTNTIAVPRRPQGAGSLRERRPGVWEVRVAIGVDPGTRRTRQRSVTVHGTRHDAERRARELTAGRAPRQVPPGPLLTMGELLALWIAADHPWKPSTLVGYRSTARALVADELADRRVSSLAPADVRVAMRRWAAEGAGPAVVAGRFRALRAALGWAYDERVIDSHPLRQMRGPGRSTPRRPLTDDDVHALLLTASTRLLEAEANDNGTPASQRRRHAAELDLLLLRLAADTGARRGELVALRVDDLQGRVLRIERAVSAETLTTPKSGHGRVLTVGAGTAALWEHLTARWQRELVEPIGPWLFSRDLSHHLRLGATTLGHRFARLRLAAGVQDATLHRLRHNVATFLVARGEILQAQSRLGHADAATTLREYAYALPLTDAPVADALEQHLLQPADPDRPCDDGGAHEATNPRRR